MNLPRALETLLLSAREPLSVSRLAALLEVENKIVLDALEKLDQEYLENESGLEIRRFANKVQLAINDRYDELIESLFEKTRSKGYGAATLEVLSIIAYEQPITRAQIDHLRGVSSDYSLRLLQDRGLIETRGTLDALGSPRLFRTTEKFLRDFSLASLDELPAVER
ncbi:MAG TPA: SMC-Scp complex subunit ScpB [Tissierellia bacterium]|nr:SMC-Scp complex subunit ScpB [Tissierellia bacterium]